MIYPSSNLPTRRAFLRTSLLGGALAYTVPGFVQRTFAALDDAAAASAVQVATGKDGPILVLLQLAGGNDGLNTLVPFADDDYYRARPKLGLPADQLHRVSDHFGLNAQLANLSRHFNDGEAAIVHGVGYPNPNRSHFRSTEIWQTASESEKESQGWVGRFFDNCCTGEDPTVGVAIGRNTPQAFVGTAGLGVTLDRPENFRFQGENSDNQAEPSANEGGSIDMLSGPVSSEGSANDFIQRVATDARLASSRINEIAAAAKGPGDYPTSGLAQQLRLVARLIAGGLPTRVYYVSLGGFDTHAGQGGRHDQLLGTADAALAAFTAELKSQGNFDRVLVMTFSEFGRRVAENNSAGTDHGAAAPLFLVGGALRSGLIGTPPSLTNLDNGDLRHTTDFRSVYATILENWLQTPSHPILKANYPKLPFLG